MKYGFRIEIEHNLPEELHRKAIEFANSFIKKGTWKTGGQRSDSFYRRGIFGLLLVAPDKLVFRRISKNRRVFGIIQPKHLVQYDNSPINYNQCMCARHLGGTRVKFIQKPETYTYYETGDIKG